MDITPLIAADRQVIQGYGGGKIRVSGTPYDHAVAVFPDRTIAWKITSLGQISEADFDFLDTEKSQLDVILLGYGSTMPPGLLKLRPQLKARGLNVDIMDTGAACRTYNVLMAEGRRIVALLIPG